MALTYQYTTEFHRPTGALTGYTYLLSIIDTQGGISGEFCCTRDGVRFSVEGNSRSIYQTIQAASVEFTMIIENATHRNFVQALTQGQEGRFIVTWNRGGIRLFTGIIFVDEVTVSLQQDVYRNGTYQPYGHYSVTATNAIGLLANKAYVDSASNLPYTEVLGIWRDPIIKHIANAFEKLPTTLKAYLPSSPIAITTDWTADVGGVPWMEHITIDHRVFLVKDRNEGLRPISCFDVLKQICEAFDFRIYPDQGKFHFEQLNSRLSGGSTYFYSLAGSPAGGGGIGASSETISCTGPLWRLSPDSRSYKPPLRSVTVRFESGVRENYLFGKKFQSVGGSNHCFTDLGIVPVPDAETRLNFKGNIQYKAVQSGGFTGQFRIIWRFRIKIGTQYYTRDLINPSGSFFLNEGSYQQAQWGGAGFFYIVNPLKTIPLSENQEIYFRFYETTLPIPEELNGEQLEICLGFTVYDDDDAVVNASQLAINAKLNDGDLKIVDLEETIIEKIALDTTVVGDDQNTRDIIRSIQFSDGFNETADNRLTDDSFSVYINTTMWTSGIGSFPHYEQLARTLMARGINAQEFLEGEIKGPFGIGFGNTLAFDGGVWIYMQGTYISGRETWSGEWFRLNIGDTGSLSKIQEELYEHTGNTPGIIGVGGGIAPICLYLEGEYLNIDVDANDFPVPDTTNWSTRQKCARLEAYRNGVGMLRYLEDPGNVKVDSFNFDPSTRLWKLGEQTRANDWLILRVWI